MKREEKNQQMRRRIMDSALAEFSGQGYGASSVNTICSSQGISKGIIYHYFKTKDELFLACVEECFSLLTEYLSKRMQNGQSDKAEEQLERYFTCRMAFFAAYPVYQRIFCEAIVSPPEHLKAEILSCKKDFDTLNIKILEQLLARLPLRKEHTEEEIIEMFRQFQDFMNARYPAFDLQGSEFELHEKQCRNTLNILLFGIIDHTVLTTSDKEENYEKPDHRSSI